MLNISNLARCLPCSDHPFRQAAENRQPAAFHSSFVTAAYSVRRMLQNVE